MYVRKFFSCDQLRSIWTQNWSLKSKISKFRVFSSQLSVVLSEFCIPVPGCSKNIETYGFHNHSKANSFHSTNSKVLHSSSPVELGHCGFDSGSISISIFEIWTFFVALTLSKANVVCFIAIITSLTPYFYRARIEFLAVETNFWWKSYAESFFCRLNWLRCMPART